MTNKFLTIHADGQEGTFQVDALTGQVIEPASVPEWASGVACALLAERIGFYEGRTPKEIATKHIDTPVVNFADLGWIGVDEEGDEVSSDADPEFRMETLATLLNIDRTDMEHGLDASTGTLVATLEDIDREETNVQTATVETLNEGLLQLAQRDQAAAAHTHKTDEIAVNG